LFVLGDCLQECNGVGKPNLVLIGGGQSGDLTVDTSPAGWPSRAEEQAKGELARFKL
jgi:hypothetical protein